MHQHLTHVHCTLYEHGAFLGSPKHATKEQARCTWHSRMGSLGLGAGFDKKIRAEHSSRGASGRWRRVKLKQFFWPPHALMHES